MDQVQNEKHRINIILLLEWIPKSHSLKSLNIFSKILNHWLRSDLSNAEKERICSNWFIQLLNKLNVDNPNESSFIFSIFQQLERIYPYLAQKKNIWLKLKIDAIERVKRCSEIQIFATTKFILQIKIEELRKLFLDDVVKDILNRTVRQINDWLLNKIFIICDCKDSRTLKVPNT